jgi:hypothetical protein
MKEMSRIDSDSKILRYQWTGKLADSRLSRVRADRGPPVHFPGEIQYLSDILLLLLLTKLLHTIYYKPQESGPLPNADPPHASQRLST